MSCHVFCKSSSEEGVDYVGLIVRDRFVTKASIELQGVTRGTMLSELNRRHVRTESGQSHGSLFNGGAGAQGSVRPVPGIAGGTMAVIAGHLNPLSRRTDKIGLEVEVVIQLDLARIDFALAQWRELRVTAIKSINGTSAMWLTISRAKMGVTLGATRV